MHRVPEAQFRDMLVQATLDVHVGQHRYRGVRVVLAAQEVAERQEGVGVGVDMVFVDAEAGAVSLENPNQTLRRSLVQGHQNAIQVTYL
jgi:hypothetical protein